MTKKLIKKLLTLTLLTFALTMTLHTVVEAYGIAPSLMPKNTAYNTVKFTDNAVTASRSTILVLQILAGALLYFAAPVATIFIAINAFRMVAGGAETDSVEQAKKGLTWTVIGLLVIILSYTIVSITIRIVIASASPPPAAPAPAATEQAAGAPSPTVDAPADSSGAK